MRIVIPGEVISEKPVRMPYSFIENGKTYAAVSGILSEEERIIPLRGPYNPLPEDYVVGVVIDAKFTGYTIELNSPYLGFLSAREMREKLALGDVIFARIRSVDEVKEINLTDGRILRGGEIVRIPPVKVPRLIGKKNSMVNLISEATGCEIYIGKNGYVWLGGRGNAQLAIKAIEKVDREAHIPGLTERVSAFLKKEKSKVI